MNSLNELIEFLNQESIDTWVYGFKNPENAFNSDYTVVYDPDSHVRTYQFDEESDRYNPFSGGIQTETMAQAFNKHIYSMRKRFDDELYDFLSRVRGDEKDLAVFISNTPDFFQLRQKVESLKCLSEITNALIVYLGKIEEEFLRFRQRFK